jgi:hypothetical protein
MDVTIMEDPLKSWPYKIPDTFRIEDYSKHVLLTLKNAIDNPSLATECRVSGSDFSRARKQTALDVVIGILQGSCSSIQSTACLKEFGGEMDGLSREAVSNANEKVKWEFIQDLFDKLCDLLFRCEKLPALNGCAVFCVDCMKLRLRLHID